MQGSKAMQRLFRGKKKNKDYLVPNHKPSNITIPPRCRALDLFHTHSGCRRINGIQFRSRAPPTHTHTHTHTHTQSAPDTHTHTHTHTQSAPYTHTHTHTHSSPSPDLGGSYKRFMKFMVQNFQKWMQQQDCQVPCGHRQTEHPRTSWGLTQTLDIQ